MKIDGMMKRGNLKAILITILVVLGVMFVVSYYSENKEIIQGLASNPGGDLCPCAGGIDPGDCDLDNLPKYCEIIGEYGGSPICGITDNCGECGCPSGKVCDDDGRCLFPGQIGGDDGGDSVNYCSGHWDCGVFELCVDDGGNLVNILEEESADCYADDYEEGNECGQCQSSIDGDGFCASTYLEEFGYRVMNEEFEICSDNVDDCFELFYLEGGCPAAGQQCQKNPFNEDEGVCVDVEQIGICEDGTREGECSLSEGSYGYVCQSDGEGGYELEESCQSCQDPYEGCPDGYECNQDGSCSVLVDEEGNPIVDEEDNYCEYVGGICEGQCGEGYYDVSELDGYEQLTDSCVEEFGASEVCCYPVDNEAVNDCEYYNGTCVANECSGNYVSPEIEYLDEECVYYVGENSVCCFEFLDSGNEEPEEDKDFFDYIFGDQTNDEYSGDKGLGENFSLNRSYIFGGLFLVVFVVLLVIIFAPKKK